MVSIQQGRLYRANGYHITIWCNVSGYLGSQEQDFEWSIYKPSSPLMKLQIVSTRDTSFTYAVYSQHVKSGKFYIERLQGDAVLLHIKKLQDQDAGEYECEVPTTENGFVVTYSAKMDLSVIPDTLSANMKPQALIRDQGDSLELTCEVTATTAQHTHLSVAWYLLQGDTENQRKMILSLSREFVLIPGSSYTQRFSTGDIKLDKIDSKTYKLLIVKVQPSDQGEMFCEAVEWIQDPDKTWKDIARKQTSKAALTVRSLDKNVEVKISAAESSLLEGEVLQINCFVQGQNTQHRLFHIVWLHNAMVVASIDPYGALAFPKDSEDRYRMGHLLVTKQSNEQYILRIKPVELKDKGVYSCKVSEMEKTPTGSFSATQQRSSSGISTNVKPRESHLKLTVWVDKEHIVEGDSLTFHCNVSAAENSLSMSWWHTQMESDPPVLIASMAQDGRLELGTSYSERGAHGDLRVEKVDSFTFTLTLYNTSATADTGLYRCEVTEWYKDRSWKYIQQISAKVESLRQNLDVELNSRLASVQLQEDFELFCRVSAKDTSHQMPLSITWRFQPSSNISISGLGYQQVVKVTARGTIEWGSAHLHFQKKTKITKSSSLSRLLVHSATWQDAGTYMCEVEAWGYLAQARDSALAAAAVLPSNPVEIKVTKPESKLRIVMHAQELEITSNEDIDIECKIISLTKEDSHLGVAWYFLPLSPTDAAPGLIIRTNYSNILEYGEAFSSRQQKHRFRSEKVSRHLYQLRISSVDYDVGGKYYCVAEEWLWSADSGWTKIGEVASGRTMVHFQHSENKPVIERTNHSITASESEDVTLECLLQSSVQSTSRFSIHWFRESNNSNPELLVTIKNNGIIEYGSGKMSRRLHPHSPSVGDFRLTLHNVEMADAGTFYCQVEEWRIVDCSTSRVQQATGQSGYSRVLVLPSVSTSSSQICSPAPLFRFILFYPLVLSLILMAIIVILCFKTKRLSMKKQIKSSRESSCNKAEETDNLKGNEVD
ncbi:hypothetical protein lerEdw1_014277 [Lerista edwardsae]|nr:hypothetical protein lerEdw1_014278 [Lerista edwardsae]KAJ6633891.1 hypothetical protein lerEdw1_014277 [Lerista edwardsae]